MRVLIADDSDLIIVRLKESLSSNKVVETVVVSKNGIDALKAIVETNPDVAILDLEMPGLSGLDLLREIRKENNSLKVIILTFYASDYYKQKALQLGADYFLSKVDDFYQVSRIVEKIEMDKKANFDQTCEN